MTAKTLTMNVTLVRMQCYKCHCCFAIDEDHYTRANEYGEAFCCPNGHSQVFSEPTTARLQKRIKLLEEEEEYQRRMRKSAEHRAETLGNSLRATKGVVTKLKKRAANGVCPCCSRHFANLHRHMQSQHPDFAVEVEE